MKFNDLRNKYKIPQTIYSRNKSIEHGKILEIPIVAAMLFVNKMNFSDSLKIFIFGQPKKMYRICFFFLFLKPLFYFFLQIVV